MFYWGSKTYFSSPVNLFELFNIFMLLNVFLFRYLTVTSLDDFEASIPTRGYLQMNVAASYSQVTSNLLAGSTIISYIKIFKVRTTGEKQNIKRTKNLI